jgi:hypothetical protein
MLCILLLRRLRTFTKHYLRKVDLRIRISGLHSVTCLIAYSDRINNAAGGNFMYYFFALFFRLFYNPLVGKGKMSAS